MNRFERSNGLDIALYIKTTFTFVHLDHKQLSTSFPHQPILLQVIPDVVHLMFPPILSPFLPVNVL